MVYRGFRQRRSDCLVQGFTLIEAIGVLVLIGILAIYATNRMGDAQFKAVAEADALRAALRYCTAPGFLDTV